MRTPSREGAGTFAGTRQYSLVRLLGKGGMGAVYEVEDRATRGRLALKIMLTQDPQRLLRFKQEFRVVAELHHKNLVRLFDLGEEGGQWFFTMELVEGQDLLEVLRHEVKEDQTTLLEKPGALGSDAREIPEGTSQADRVACDLEAFRQMMAQILDALEFLHKQGLVHRDLKPSNILVSQSGVVRLLDFGLASRVDGASLREDGALVGTLAYMSPEQCRGQSATPASDLYALGCMMFQLLTGQLPFQGTPTQLIQARLHRTPPRVERRVSGVPEDLSEICHRLLARIPEERPSLSEIRAALGIVHTSGAASASPPVHERSAPGEQPFVGRQRELEALRGCLARAKEGHLQLALVSGESGIGKSTLAQRFLREAQAEGFLCLSGRCYEREQVPFVALDRAVDALIVTLSHWPEERLAPLLAPLETLRPLFPAVGVLTDGRRPGGVLEQALTQPDPRERYQRAFAAFRRIVAYCQEQAPLCLVLDDLQWADEESIELLESLLSESAGRVLVLGLSRPEGLSKERPMQRLLPLARRGVVLSLAGLVPEEVVALTEAMAGGPLEPETKEALLARAEGNPFLALQLASYLAKVPPPARPSLLRTQKSADAWFISLTGALSPRAEALLSVAATVGGDAPRRLLSFASGLGAEDFDLALGELMSARLLKALPPVAHLAPIPGESQTTLVLCQESTAQAGGRSFFPAAPTPRQEQATVPARLARWGGAGQDPLRQRQLDRGLEHLDLYHDRLRETAYARLAPDRRRKLHHALALAFEALPGSRGLDVEALLMHWTEAGDREKRRHFAASAAEQAAEKLAFRRAAQLFRIVLDDPAPGEAYLITAARWERVGDLCEYSGQLDEASKAYQHALTLWERSPDEHEQKKVALLRLRGRVGENLMATGKIKEGQKVYASGLALMGLPLSRPLPLQLATLARLQLTLSLQTLLPSPRSHPQATPFEEAQLRFLDLMVRVMMPLWPLPAVEAGMRSELLGRRFNDQRLLLRITATKGATSVFLQKTSPKDLKQAHKTLDEAEALAEKRNLPLGREIVQLNRGLLLVMTDLERARRENEAAQEGFARHGMAEFYDGAVARMYYLIILFFKGDYDDALLAIERELLRTHPNFNNTILFLLYKARILTLRGQHDEAEEVLSRVRALLKDIPACYLTLFSSLARQAWWVAKGHFAKTLEEGERDEPTAKSIGILYSGYNKGCWLAVSLEASLGLARQGKLSGRRRARAKQGARELAHRGVLDFGCLGYRALALFAESEGHQEEARQEIGRALTRSRQNTNPHRRWLCLTAAIELNAASPAMKREAEALAKKHRFTPPPGW